MTVGSAATKTFIVTNQGSGVASGVTFTDPLPANTTPISATASQGTCTGTTTVTCNLGTLAPGGSATVTLVLTPAAAAVGTLANTATVSSVTAGSTLATTTITISGRADTGVARRRHPLAAPAGSTSAAADRVGAAAGTLAPGAPTASGGAGDTGGR